MSNNGEGEFWSGTDDVPQTDGSGDPVDETDVISSGTTYREIHAALYGIVISTVALLVLGPNTTVAVGLLVGGVVVAAGLKATPEKYQPNVVVRRALVKEPGWFAGGMIAGFILGSVLRAVVTVTTIPV